ncbi:hypothetical protein GCM10018790_66360 [Kitasatospora xanthocidica]|nr:hypothetical protein GCM10018790_66360 [Kitasatospora xanthocidica]
MTRAALMSTKAVSPALKPSGIGVSSAFKPIRTRGPVPCHSGVSAMRRSVPKAGFGQCGRLFRGRDACDARVTAT